MEVSGKGRQTSVTGVDGSQPEWSLLAATRYFFLRHFDHEIHEGMILMTANLWVSGKTESSRPRRVWREGRLYT
jgi:hypothetical protein